VGWKGYSREEGLSAGIAGADEYDVKIRNMETHGAHCSVQYDEPASGRVRHSPTDLAELSAVQG